MNSTVTGRVATSISSGDVCTQVCHMRLRHIGEKSSQDLEKKGSLEGASTYSMKLGGHDILDKKTKVKFGASTHRLEGLLDFVHISIWGPAKTASLGGHQYFDSFIDNLSRHSWIYPMRQRFESLGMLVKWKDMIEK